MSYTPGPWYVLAPGNVCLDDLRDLDKREWGVYADSFGDKVHHISSGGMTEANARLVAAAPTLLRVLTDIAIYRGGKNLSAQLQRRAEMAIRLAYGDSNG